MSCGGSRSSSCRERGLLSWMLGAVSQSSSSPQGPVVQTTPPPPPARHPATDTQGPLGGKAPDQLWASQNPPTLQSEPFPGVPCTHLPMSGMTPTRSKAHCLFFLME